MVGEIFQINGADIIWKLIWDFSSCPPCAKYPQDSYHHTLRQSEITHSSQPFLKILIKKMFLSLIIQKNTWFDI